MPAEHLFSECCLQQILFHLKMLMSFFKMEPVGRVGDLVLHYPMAHLELFVMTLLI